MWSCALMYINCSTFVNTRSPVCTIQLHDCVCACLCTFMGVKECIGVYVCVCMLYTRMSLMNVKQCMGVAWSVLSICTYIQCPQSGEKSMHHIITYRDMTNVMPHHQRTSIVSFLSFTVYFAYMEWTVLQLP